MKVFATYSIKGGVGKTSAAVNLAHLAARDGLRTLVWDLDPQGAATFLLRVKPKVKGGGAALVSGRRALADAVRATEVAGLDVVPADFSYRTLDIDLDDAKRSAHRVEAALRPLRREYDVVFLDSPPGASLVSENVIRACDVLVVPVVPALLSVRTFDMVSEFVDSLVGNSPEILGFLSMVDRRKKIHRDLVASLPSDHPAISSVVVPALSVVEQMAEHRAPVTQYAPRSVAARAYQDLWSELHRRMGVVQAPKVLKTPRAKAKR